MYIIAIGWLYVSLMMAAAEASSSNGSVLGALFTFIGYGLIPVALLVYLMQRASRRGKAAPPPPDGSNPPDAGGHAAGAAEPGGVAPVREES